MVKCGVDWNIPCRSLPQCYQEEGMKNLLLIKMDVEGAEFTVSWCLDMRLRELYYNRSVKGGKPAFGLSPHRPNCTKQNYANTLPIELENRYLYIYTEK